jgi:esterase/lipase
MWNLMECIAVLSHGLTSPSQLRTKVNNFKIEDGPRANLALVLGHGLGSKDPRTKTYETDDMIKILTKGTEITDSIESVILYTARGHGTTNGWQETAESDPEQFSWNRLADDMVNAGTYFGYEQLVVGGSSMGSATALYAAIKYPERVKGLIIAKPPTGWTDREARKKYLVGSAKKLKEIEEEGGKYHAVLMGATTANFPPLDDLQSYQKISCPVLILGLLGDESHPEITARNLHERIPQSELYFANDYQEAELLWPELIQKFLSKIH